MITSILIRRFHMIISILIAGFMILSITAQVGAPVLTMPDPQSYTKSMAASFEEKIKRYVSAHNEFADAFHDLMEHRGSVWNVKEARKVSELRDKAERAGDKVFNHSMYRK